MSLKKGQSSPKKGHSLQNSFPVSGRLCPLMLWNVWDRYFRKQQRCLKSTKMKQPSISRITETDWTGAGIPTADSSDELMKICTKILSRLSLREEKSEQISATPRANICRHKTKNCSFSFPPTPLLSFQLLSDLFWWKRLTVQLPQYHGSALLKREAGKIPSSGVIPPCKQTLSTSSEAGLFPPGKVIKRAQ